MLGADFRDLSNAAEIIFFGKLLRRHPTHTVSYHYRRSVKFIMSDWRVAIGAFEPV